MKQYVVHYFKPEPNRYAYHTTYSWLWAKFILWLIKKNGWTDAYMEDFNELRLACVREYGWNFGELYDMICSGIPIGGLDYTANFLDKVEQVKQKYGNTRVDICESI